MGILNEIGLKQTWLAFYEYKCEKRHLTEIQKNDLHDFIDNEEYMPIVQKIKEEGFCFEYPEKKQINKIDVAKKRTVYSFAREESYILKLITYLMYRYDFKQSDNCYSFRRDCGVKRAIRRITNTFEIDSMYCYKVDIHNYFNSINVDKLLPILKDTIDDDYELYEFLKDMLLEDKAYFEDDIIEEKRGAMAGVPISVFLANIYLKGLDDYFEENDVLYARYSDDIILFSNTREELESHIDYIHGYLKNMDLEINTDKENVIKPNEAWEFLGIKYYKGTVDISDNSKQKMKGKIRRKARSIYRWKVRKGASDERAMKAFIRSFNVRLFESSDNKELTWTRWYFPIINTDTSLRDIDAYMQQYIRYLSTGKHNKSNYRIDYIFMKECGYKSLVNEYYRYLSDDIYVMTR